MNKGPNFVDNSLKLCKTFLLVSALYFFRNSCGQVFHTFHIYHRDMSVFHKICGQLFHTFHMYHRDILVVHKFCGQLFHTSSEGWIRVISFPQAWWKTYPQAQSGKGHLEFYPLFIHRQTLAYPQPIHHNIRQ